MLLTPAHIKPKSFQSRRNYFFIFFTRGGCASCLRTCLGARLLPQSYQYPNLSEGADRVAGQLRGDKECPFSGVTKSGRVWKKVPESGARSVHWVQTLSIAFRHLPPNSARFGYATEVPTLYLRADAVRQRHPKGLGTNMTVEATKAPKHPRTHETHPPRVKKKKKKGRVPSRFKRLWFYLCWCKLCWRL